MTAGRRKRPTPRRRRAADVEIRCLLCPFLVTNRTWRPARAIMRVHRIRTHPKGGVV